MAVIGGVMNSNIFFDGGKISISKLPSKTIIVRITDKSNSDVNIYFFDIDNFSNFVEALNNFKNNSRCLKKDL
jgi:hypothetical protein